MTGPLYSIVMAVHVLSAVVGFGALAATGWYASALVRRGERPVEAPTLRYFRPGRNWAARTIVLVPILGGVLLALGHGTDVDKSYPWIGLALWFVATAVASSMLWPAERELQRRLASIRPGEPAPVDDALPSAAKRCERAAAITTVLFVVALVVMIAQP